MCEELSLPVPNFHNSYSSLNRNINQAPYIEVSIKALTSSSSSGNNIIKTQGLLDTGASQTCIPTSLLNRINAQRLGKRRFRSFGQQNSQDTYKRPIEICLLNDSYRDLVVLEWQDPPEGQEFIIIGRDILNKYSIMFDGLGLINEMPFTYHIWE